MVLKIIQFITILVLNINHSAANRQIVDIHLRALRFNYKEFQYESKINLDKSFFEIYGVVEEKIKKIQKPYQNLYKIWKHMCENFENQNLDRDVNHMFEVVCSKTTNLLKSAENLNVVSMQEFFPGSLLEPSPPEVYFIKSCEQFETEVEQIFDVYNANKNCAKAYLYQLIPILKPILSEILNFTVTTIKKVDLNYEHCLIFHEIAVKYVERFIHDIKNCKYKTEVSDCVKKQVNLIFLIKIR